MPEDQPTPQESTRLQDDRPHAGSSEERPNPKSDRPSSGTERPSSRAESSRSRAERPSPKSDRSSSKAESPSPAGRARADRSPSQPSDRPRRRPRQSNAPPPDAPKSAPPAAQNPEQPQATPSKTPSPLTKAVQTATQLLSSGFSLITKPLVKSKFYTNNKAKFDTGWKRVQPLVKIVQWLWNQILKPFWNRVVQPLWAKLLELLRPRLPEPLQTLSDRILTAIILGPLVLLWWLVSSVTSAGSIAQPPPSKPVVTAPTPPPQSSAQQPVTEAPVVSAPEIPEPEPEPEPLKTVLTVQQQVSEISDRYPDVIPSVQANFETNRLVVQVSDRWYDLSNAEQDEMGLDVLHHSDDLEFQALELRDQQGQLVARDPVVGPNIIILRRHLTELPG